MTDTPQRREDDLTIGEIGRNIDQLVRSVADLRAEIRTMGASHVSREVHELEMGGVK